MEVWRSWREVERSGSGGSWEDDEEEDGNWLAVEVGNKREGSMLLGGVRGFDRADEEDSVVVREGQRVSSAGFKKSSWNEVSSGSKLSKPSSENDAVGTDGNEGIGSSWTRSKGAWISPS